MSRPHKPHKVIMIRLKLDNIIVAALGFAALIVLLRSLPEIAAFLSTLDAIGSNTTPEDKLKGFIAAGFLGVCLVAIVRILVSQREP